MEINNGYEVARKWMAHYVDTAMPGEKQAYALMGDDLEEYNAELEADFWGSNVYSNNPAVKPYYANKGTPLFDRLADIIDNARMLEEICTTVVEVKLWEDELQDGVYPAICEKAVFEVASYGGDTIGYQIPFTLHYTGDKCYGIFNVATKKFES